jgi:Spy/CpxP family protein refolding chaperone
MKSKIKMRLLSALLIIGVVAAGGAAIAQGSHTMMMHHSEDMVAHVNGMLQYLYDDVGASDAQKAKLAAISQAATDDLTVLHGELANTHTQVFALLTQDTVDRTALETLRAGQMRVADDISKRVTLFIADIAETLTPTQRKALAAHFAQHAD